MRVVAWIFILAAAVAATSLFLPAIEADLGAAPIKRRASLSMPEAAANRALVHNFLAAYHRDPRRRVGAALLGAIHARAERAHRAVLGEVRDVDQTLESVNAQEAETMGEVLVVAVWSFLGLQVLAILLVFVESHRGRFRVGRVATALALSALAAPIAIGAYLLTGVAAAEANAELRLPLIDRGVGATLLPAAAIAGVMVAVVLLVATIRSRRRAAQAPASGSPSQ